MGTMIITSVSLKDNIWKSTKWGLIPNAPIGVGPSGLSSPTKGTHMEGETLVKWEWALPEEHWQSNHEGLELVFEKWVGSR
jgi:hypothetical protein